MWKLAITVMLLLGASYLVDAQSCTQMFSCANCSTLSICTGDVSISTECPSESPYCGPTPVGNVGCSSVPTADCANTNETNEEGFQCTGRGYFPDPVNCKRYHICGKGANTSFPVDCPSSSRNIYYYNTRLERCDRALSSCLREPCAVSSGILVPFGPNNMFYVLCNAVSVNGATVRQPTLVFRCPDGSSFQNAQNKCVYRCSGEGNFFKSDDVHQYYHCHYTNNVLSAKVAKCPFEMIFNAAVQVCVDDPAK